MNTESHCTCRDHLSSASRLESDLLEGWSEIEKIRTEWDALVDQTSYPTTYSTFNFCVYGWSHFHKDDSSPFVVTVRDNGKLVAVFPLRREISYVYKIKYTLLQPLHTTETDKPYPLIANSFEQASWHAFSDCLKAHKGTWDILYWPEIPDQLHGVELIQQAFLNIKPYTVETHADVFGPILNLDQTWEEFRAKHRKLRKAVARINNKLEGGVHLKVYRTPAEIDTAIEIYSSIENSGWKAGKIGVARNDISRNFYRDLAGEMSKNDQIRIGVLYHGTTAISAEIAYTCGNRVFFSHGTYDPAYKDVSPGKISTGLFIKEFLDDDFKHGDFLAGFAHYLTPWCDELMTTTKVYVYNRRPAVRAIWAWRKTKTWLKEKYKNHPMIKAAAENIYTRIAKAFGIDVNKANA